MVDAIPAQITLKNRSKLFDKTSPLEETFPLGDILAIVCHGSTLGRAIDGQGHVPFPLLRHVHANWRLVRVEGNAAMPLESRYRERSQS